MTAVAVGAPLACDANSRSDDDMGGSPSGMPGDGGDDTGDDDGGSGDGATGMMDDGDDGGSAGDGVDGGDDGSMDIEPADMIDDFEDCNTTLYVVNGRQGAWYTYNDASETGMQEPPEPFAPAEGGTPGSLCMAKTSGNDGFTVWGAGLGVDLNNEGELKDGTTGERLTYDASAYAGIVFHARGTGNPRVKILHAAIVPPEAGGTCEAGMECEDAWGKGIATTDEWQQFQVPFDDLMQEGWGLASPLDLTTLMAIQFQVGAGKEFDFEIDNLGFY